MIIVLKKNPEKNQYSSLVNWITGQGIRISPIEGTQKTVLGLVGDTSKVDVDLIGQLDIVESVICIQEPDRKGYRKPAAPEVPAAEYMALMDADDEEAL